MLFTVEQIELIRKLHVTGISSDQVLKAFGELEVPEPLQNNNKIPASVYSPLLVQHLTSSPTTSSPVTPAAPAVVIPSSLDVSIKSEPLTPTPAPVKTENLPVFEHPICSSAPRPIRSSRTPMKEITTLDDPNELEEFMRQGEEACILDMKTFITQYSLRQTTVAMMTGVSQPYISKLLNGNHRELSLRCRKNIYCWYLNCRRHPNKLSAFLADPSTRLETNGDGELIPQRRERYVFRPILIRMLESFFHQTPFPDLPRRVEIATACNHVLQLDKKGVGLMPKEVVSPQVVSNWFANKRKELRRRSAEANASSASSSSSSSMNAANTDSSSIPSMSPASRDDEASSRNTTPETISPSPASSSSSIDIQSTLVPSTTPFTAPTTPTLAMPMLIPPATTPLELLAIAQRLGIQLPLLDSNPFANSFVPFSIPTLPASFYNNSSSLKTE